MAERLALRDFQERFFALISARRAAPNGTEGRKPKPEGIEALALGDDRLDAFSRLDVYADMYFHRLLDFIEEDYPKLAAVLGPAAFHELLADYLEDCPPSHPTARNTGANLPAFAARHPTALLRPWLPELVALEWARVEVFDRADTPVLTLGALSAIPAQDFARLSLSAISAQALVPVSYAVEEVWQHIESKGPLIEPRKCPGSILVWRSQVEIHHRRLDEIDERAFNFLRHGLTFGDFCERFSEGRTLEEAARFCSQIVAQWLSSGLLAYPPELGAR